MFYLESNTCLILAAPAAASPRGTCGWNPRASAHQGTALVGIATADSASRAYSPSRRPVPRCRPPHSSSADLVFTQHKGGPGSECRSRSFAILRGRELTGERESALSRLAGYLCLRMPT